MSFAEYLHLLVKPIVENKGVGDTESVGFHRVQLAVVEVPHLQAENTLVCVNLPL